MVTALLEMLDLAKSYGDVRALDGLSLQAWPGRLLGFLGPNGAGKTTSMRSVFGLVRPDRGKVQWQGGSITSEVLLQAGYMPEQRGLYPRMAAAAQLSYLGQLHGMARTEAEQAATRWLEELGLADRAGDKVSELSHGNQQRVQLAAALVHEPELLVLDEPFNGLDPLGVAAMSRVLRDRAADGATVVFSSHQLDLVEELCDDVVIIAAGRDRLAGTLEQVRSAAPRRTVEVRLVGGVDASVPGFDVAEVRDGLHRGSVASTTAPAELLAALSMTAPVERFAFEPPSLSEIFKEVVGRDLHALEAEDAA